MTNVELLDSSIVIIISRNVEHMDQLWVFHPVLDQRTLLLFFFHQMILSLLKEGYHTFHGEASPFGVDETHIVYV